MPEHTPAPWHVVKRDNRELGSVHYAIETVAKLPQHPWSTRLVCWMSGSLGDSLHNRKPEDTRDDPEIEADAYLLSAAPEMHAALWDAMTVLHDVGHKGQHERCALCAIALNAFAALAKADGKARA